MSVRRTFIAVACFAAVFVASGASAVKIDPELQQAFQEKTGRAKLPVLMIFDRPNQLPPGMIGDLHRADPAKRRRAVIAALKRKAGNAQRNARDVLQNPIFAGEVDNVRYLYLANAITFHATWELIEELGLLPDDAILHLDRTYDLTAATDRGAARSAGSGDHDHHDHDDYHDDDDDDIGSSAVAATDTVWSVKYINADRVWNDLGYTGAGIVVGHIDTGVWLTHPDLAGRLWTNTSEIPGNGVDDDSNGFIDDINGWDFGAYDNNPNDDSPGGGHGTHTAGSVAGDGSGTILTGVAPGAKIMALKVWQADGTGGTLGMIWSAQQYAVENGARIITMSLGIPGTIPDSFLRAERFNDNNIREAGVIFFNSAGNDHFSYAPPEELGMTARVPAPWNELAVPYSSTSGVITVGGTGYKSDGLYSSSSRGPATWQAVDPFNDWPYSPGPGLIKPDVVAPAVGVNSTVRSGGYSGDTWNGTSMACPHVAGVAALMLDKNPSLSPTGIDSLLEQTAIDLGVAGKDNSYGSGRVDAFAAVSAVPAGLNPDLGWLAVLPDPAGDAVIDPGEVSELAIRLRNVSPVTDATGVTGSLAVVANPYVTVSDASGNFGTISLGGGTADNTSSTFSLNVAPGTPQGFTFTMLLTVTASGTYAETFDIPWYVGLPEWRTHDQGGVYLTVTDQGTLGYMTDGQTDGDGMGYQDGGSGLFIGSFWAGTDASYICNRDYSGLGSETFEWEVSPADPNGRVRDLGATKSDQTFKAVFSDAGHASPKPLQVEQVSMAFGLPQDDRFVILEYRLTNFGVTDIPALYTGVFCDFDLGNSAANEGGTDPSRNLTYLYEPGGTYMGIALIGAANSATNLTVINNPTYVYPTSSIDDGMKMRHLRGVISTPVTSGLDDWSALTSAEVTLPGNGGTAMVAYVLVIGGSLGDLQAAVDAANAAYNPLSAAPDDPDALQLVRLAQNAPNPFNPITQIRYVVPRDGRVDLAVYDLAGRLVRSLVSGVEAAGERSVTWNGRDDAGQEVPSGMYFYRVTTAGQTVARKMLLVK